MMTTRRFALAVGVAFLLTTIVDILLNAVLFRQVYVEAASHLLPPDQLNARVPLGWGAMLVILLGNAILFRAGRWPWPAGAFRFGLLIALMGVAGVAGMASLVPWPAPLLGAMAVQQAVNGILLGLVLGWFSRGSG